MTQVLTEGVYYILLSLHERRHGYGIMQHVEKLSNGRVTLGAGTVYGALKSLQEKKWISSLEGTGRKKEYIITPKGQHIFQSEVQRLRELYDNGIILLKSNEKGE